MRCQTIGCRATGVWTWHVNTGVTRFAAVVCHDHLQRTAPVTGGDRCAVVGCERGASAMATLRPTVRARNAVPIPLCFRHGQDASTQYASEITWLDTMAPRIPVAEHA